MPVATGETKLWEQVNPGEKRKNRMVFGRLPVWGCAGSVKRVGKRRCKNLWPSFFAPPVSIPDTPDLQKGLPVHPELEPNRLVRCERGAGAARHIFSWLQHPQESGCRLNRRSASPSRISDETDRWQAGVFSVWPRERRLNQSRFVSYFFHYPHNILCFDVDIIPYVVLFVNKLFRVWTLQKGKTMCVCFLYFAKKHI